MRYGAALIICTVIAAAGLFIVHSRDETSMKIAGETELLARIQKVGAARAYKELVAQEADKSSTEQHSFGHMFGRMLYRAEGVDGFSICDRSLLYGCFHEFIARAIIDNGFSVVPRLVAQCSTPSWPTACYHGIGHGLVVYLGYSPTGLEKSLDECSKYPEHEPAEGCYGGVFMETNLQTMSRGGPLSFSELGQRGVCENVASQYRAACFFWLPQWWRDSHFKDGSLNELFDGLGNLCTKASQNTEERTWCFKGIGYIASPSVEFDFEKTRALCERVSRSKKDQQDCWEKASQSAGHKPS